MKPYARIAAIILGAFALGVVGVIGWAALVVEAADIRDRMRRARCDWVDPLAISIAGHEFSIAASPGTVVFTGERWIGGEEVSGYRTEPSHFGFCLDGPPDGPPDGSLPARSVTLALDAARGLVESAGLPAVGGPKIEIGEAALFLPEAPAPNGQSSDLIVFHRNTDFGWPRMVTEGVDRDGFRIGAVCRDGAAGGWLCDLSVHDTRTDLAYRYERLAVETAGFDGRPIPAPFLRAARGMRKLCGMLEADAVARR